MIKMEKILENQMKKKKSRKKKLILGQVLRNLTWEQIWIYFFSNKKQL